MSSRPHELAGRVAVVTGANNPTGIGAAVARALVSRGANVMITYLRLEPERWGVSASDAASADEPSEALYQHLRSRGPEDVLRSLGQTESVHSIEADLTAGPEVVEEIFDAINERFGHCDVLVNCAAHYAGRSPGLAPSSSYGPIHVASSRLTGRASARGADVRLLSARAPE